VVESYLPPPGPERDDLLPHLVAVELHRRCTGGEAVKVEDYLARFPTLAEQPAAVVELLAIEYRHRLPPPTTDELQRRFPDHVSALAARLGTASTTLPTADSSVSAEPQTVSAAGEPKAAHAKAESALPVVPSYEIIKELGHGGMGVVYLAWQTSLKRLVALKRIRVSDHADERARARFRTEAEAVARLQHPNIVQIHEIGEAEGLPFISLEYVEGRSLAEYLRGKPLPPLQAAALVQTLAQAVHHAHERGIIHRDLKPANVLLAFSRESATSADIGRLPLSDCVPKITDFGLAKLVDLEQGQTQSGEIMGTAAYVSPEQAMGTTAKVGRGTDVYSLGAILYELLTGRPPFLVATIFDAMVELLYKEPLPPRRLQPGIPRDLETICLKCLEKETARRYPGAAALAEDLRRFQAGEPIAARPVGRLERGWRWCRRNPLVAGLVAAVAVALCGGTSIATWQAVVARDQARRADAKAHEAETRLEQIDKGTDILGSIFADLDPNADEKEGKPLREILGQRVERAAEQLEGESIADDLTVAKLQTILAHSLIGLGHYGAAASLLTNASATRAAELGDEHPDTLISRSILASAYENAGKLNLAIPLYESTLRSRETQLGADHPDTLKSRNNLALAYQKAGKLNLAMPLYESTLKSREAQLGTDHPDTLASRNNLASAYRAAGQLDRAIPLWESTLKAREALLGEDHPETLMSRNNLAFAYQAAGKLDLAIPLYERTLKAQQAKLGDEHPTTLTYRNNLAGAYNAAGQLERAIALFQQTLPALESKLGNDHPLTLTARNNLASAYQDTGQLDLAIPMYQRNIRVLETKLGSDHPSTLTSRHNLANAYQEAGQLDLAIALYQSTLLAKETKLGADHPSTLASRNGLATAYRDAGKLDLALRLFEQVVPQAQKKLGRRHPSTVRWTQDWITALETHHQYSRAIEVAKELVLEQRKAVASDDPRLAAALAQLGNTLLAAKQPRDAEPALRESLAIRTTKEPEAWTTFSTQSVLGAALLAQKKYADAEPLLLRSYEGMKHRHAKIPPPSKARLTEALERLVQLYEATGKKDETVKWRKELDAVKAATKKR
jgi:serine/threonine protein kinase